MRATTLFHAAFLAVAASLFHPAAVCAATLVYSNDVLGELEPCGCRSNPLGGMDRRAELIRRLLEKDPQLLQVDGGDLLFQTTPVPDALAKQSEVQATYILKALDLMGMDVIVPGEKDFALGVAMFEKLRHHSKAAFLAANLVRRDGKPFLKPDAVFVRKKADGKKLRIAVLGLVGKEMGWPSELKVTPVLDIARKKVPELRAKADLVVVVSHQGYDADAALARSVKGIDIIVGAHSQTFLQEPKKVGNTWIYQSSFRNQYVGVLPLKTPLTSEGHELVGLDAGYQVENAVASLIKESRAEINKVNESDKPSLQAQPSGNSKYQTFVKCSECHLKQFDFWRQTRHAAALDVLIKVDREKNQACFKCHTVGFGDKEGFSNVNELAERKKSPPPGSDADSSSTDERASGPRELIAFDDVAQYLKSVHDAKTLDEPVKITRADAVPIPLRKSLASIRAMHAPVQCENCHQPGRDHPFSGTYAKKVETSVCLNCHREDQAPKWYSNHQPDMKVIDEKRKLVTCPAGELAE